MDFLLIRLISDSNCKYSSVRVDMNNLVSKDVEQIIISHVYLLNTETTL